MIKYMLASALAALPLSCGGSDRPIDEMGRAIAEVSNCFEDEAAVVRPHDPGEPTEGLNWVCVPLDNFLDAEGFARLGEQVAPG